MREGEGTYMWFNIQFPHFTPVHIALFLLKKLYEICLATPVTENFPDLQCSKLSTVQVSTDACS